MQGFDESKQDIENPQVFTYDTEGEVSRIYGSFEGNLTSGISMYIEPSESSDPEKLKFTIEVLEFSSSHLSM